MTELDQYRAIYPFIPVEVLEFFDKNINQKKNVMNFCDYYKKKYNTKNIPQPRVVSAICEVLRSKAMLTSLGSTLSNIDGMGNMYVCFLNPGFDKVRDELNERTWFELCAFPSIYSDYRDAVLALRHFEREEGVSHLGTAFVFRDVIVTAKHCIEGARAISLKNVSLDEIKDAKIFFHRDPNMDLAIISPAPTGLKSIKYIAEPNILTDVITMGYPLLAGFHNFLTVEKAQISSRFTATYGQITAVGEDIFLQKELILITAKIKGGNSGGPVIDKTGGVVGVTSQENFGKGNQYDNLGYGVAIPIKHVVEDLLTGREVDDVTKNYRFVDFDSE